MSDAKMTSDRPYLTFDYDFSKYKPGSSIQFMLQVDEGPVIVIFSFTQTSPPQGGFQQCNVWDNDAKRWADEPWVPTPSSSMNSNFPSLKGTLTFQYDVPNERINIWLGTNFTSSPWMVFEKQSGLSQAWASSSYTLYGAIANNWLDPNSVPNSWSPPTNSPCSFLPDVSSGNSMNLSRCSPGGTLSNLLYFDSPLGCCLGLGSPSQCGDCAPTKSTTCDETMINFCKLSNASPLPYCQCLNTDAKTTGQPWCWYSPCVFSPRAYKPESLIQAACGTFCENVINLSGKYNTISQALMEATCGTSSSHSSTSSSTRTGIILGVVLVALILLFIGIYLLWR